MRSRYYVKIVCGYLFFCACVFLLTATFTRQLVKNHLTHTQSSQLLAAVCSVASCHGADELRDASDTSLRQEMLLLSSSFDADFWLVDSDGTSLALTDRMSLPLSDDFAADGLIDGFFSFDLAAGGTHKGDLYGTFSEKCIVAASPLQSDADTVLLLIEPMSSVTASSNSFINIYFYTAAVIFLISFLLLTLFTYFMYQPLYRILQGTRSFAEGNYTKPIAVSSHDEIGDLADTLNYMASAILTREEDQRRFIANISHDFRSPLTSIKGYTDALLDGTIPPELQKHYLSVIRSETERLQKLTDNLLELNRCGSGGLILEISVFDLTQLIREVLPTFEGEAKQKSLRFSFDFPSEGLFVSGDRDKIARVLYNLTDNAVKFSQEGSTITFSASSSGGKAIFCVRDFGIVIPPQSLSKIWDRFYKEDRSRGRDRTGSGLGLSIIKEIITSHGEHIEAESTKEGGTAFTFTLPLA